MEIALETLMAMAIEMLWLLAILKQMAILKVKVTGRPLAIERVMETVMVIANVSVDRLEQPV